MSSSPRNCEMKSESEEPEKVVSTKKPDVVVEKAKASMPFDSDVSGIILDYAFAMEHREKMDTVLAELKDSFWFKFQRMLEKYRVLFINEGRRAVLYSLFPEIRSFNFSE